MSRRKLTLLLDTNVIVDALGQRAPHDEKARLLLTCGCLGEMDLWLSASQVTDLFYILSGGGKPSRQEAVRASLRQLRRCVRVCPVDAVDVDRALADGQGDFEDDLMVELALKVHADAVITRNRGFPHPDYLRVMNCTELFAWCEEELGLAYGEEAF